MLAGLGIELPLIRRIGIVVARAKCPYRRVFGSARCPEVLSTWFGESYASTSDQSQARPDEGKYPGGNAAAYPGVAAGRDACAYYDCYLLAGDGERLRQL